MRPKSPLSDDTDYRGGHSASGEDSEGVRATRRELERLSARLQRTLESITDAFFTLDREWRFSYLNSEAERIIGSPRHELIGKAIWDVFPGFSGSTVEEHYRTAIQTGEAVYFETVAPTSARWFSVRVYPSEDGLSVYFHDVSHEKERAATLRASEERFRLAARATSDTVWDWDVERGEIWWNDGLRRVFGYPEGEGILPLKVWEDRIHPEDRERVLQGVVEFLRSEGNHWEDRYRFRCADGGHVSVVDRGFVIRDADGRAVRMVGGIKDLTAVHEAARRIKEQAALLDRARDAILVREIDGTIVLWNQSAERLYGWSREEAIGKSAEILLYQDPSEYRKALAALIADDEWTGELAQVDRLGNTVLIEGRWSLIRDEKGQPQRVLAINTDITEKKRMEAQFLRAQRMESIGTLASGIAHDLNNVLAPILMSIELLKMDIADPDILDTLRTIESSAIRGAAMVKQVLAFARGIDGERIPVSVARVVKDVHTIVGDTLPRNIRIETSIPDGLWLIRGDPTQIHQVILNLAVNARDAMHEGGVLKIIAENVWVDDHIASMERALRTGPHVLLQVIDTGTGISPEALERVFEPFFTTKDVGRGTGLGLSTVQAIVRSHGGCVNVHSEVGKGASFRLYFPADAEAVEEVPIAVPMKELHRGNGELILVADDEAAIRSVTQQTLEAFGYRVITAEDGTAALAAYAQNQDEVALVLTDIMMPNLDGLATIPALRRMKPDVKIIATTGLRGQGFIARARAAGVLEVIEKPYSAERLLSALGAALSSG